MMASRTFSCGYLLCRILQSDIDLKGIAGRMNLGADAKACLRVTLSGDKAIK
jgi:hypothetical protein